MNTIQRITTSTIAAVTLLATYLLTAATASASPAPVNDGSGFPPPNYGTSGTGGVTTTIVNTGSPWWTFALVAAAGVASAAGAAVLISRVRHHKPARLAVSG